MLDSVIRPYLTPSLDKIAERIEAYQIPVNLITVAALIIGLVGCFCVAIQSYFFGLILLLASRILAGLDGAVARRLGVSDFGTYFDTVCDLIFYAAFVFFFVIALPNHMLAGLFLIFSYIGTFGSLLAYDILAEKRGVATSAYAPTSLFAASSLAEKSEMMIFMAIVCLSPETFSAVAFLFGILCWITTFGRTMQAWTMFGQTPEPVTVDYTDDTAV